jgi:hypothetical protein
MMSALILVDRGPQALAVTLSALVAGVADGVVADAVVIARHDDPDVARIADATGAGLVIAEAERNPWSAAAPMARRDWLLLLRDGDVLGEGWTGALDRFVMMAEGAGGSRPIGRLTRDEGGPLRRLISVAARRRSRPQPGDVIHRAHLGGGVSVRRIHARITREPAGR